MNATRFLSTENLARLAELRLGAGERVIVPQALADGSCEYRVLEAGRPAHIDLDTVIPRRSLKEFFLPPTEPLFRWKRDQHDVQLLPVPPDAPPTLVLGARPCDAAALPVVDRVMDWDYHDEPWFARRAATTIVTVVCGPTDASCFCTAVGLGPDAAAGADVLMAPVAGGYAAELLTDCGERLAAQHADLFVTLPEPGGRDAVEFAARARMRVEGNAVFDATAVAAWGREHFDDPFWDGLALRCHGCGACAAMCPTCHCFDIVDEPEGIWEGARRRNWDTCQAAKFTLHGSGHNPRPAQNSRFRQRVLHKFTIYPGKFGAILCTGCGRCARACPGGMNLQEALHAMTLLAGGNRP